MRCCHLNSIRDPFDCRPMNDDVADEDVSVCCYLVIRNRLSSSVVVVVDCDVVAGDCGRYCRHCDPNHRNLSRGNFLIGVCDCFVDDCDDGDDDCDDSEVTCCFHVEGDGRDFRYIQRDGLY